MTTLRRFLIPLLLCLQVSAQGAARKASSTNSATPCVIAPGEVWLDDKGVAVNAHGGGILPHEGRYYWFGEHKTAGSEGNRAHVGVHCYSSDDLCHWKDEGIALGVSADTGSEIAEGCVLERPKVIYNAKTGKFVMWFHLELKGCGYSSARAGVAVADKVTGPYTYLGSFRPNAGSWPQNFDSSRKTPLSGEDYSRLKDAGQVKKGDGSSLRRDFEQGQMARDMTLFVDEDGKAYLLCASEENATLQLSLLTEDYLKPSGTYWRILEGKANEAPALFKHEGKYYLITSGCSGWAPNATRLAVADSIQGPWRELGNPCVGEGRETTFRSQSTYVLPVQDNRGEFQFLFMADRWVPENAIDGRYIWLPIRWNSQGNPFLEWKDRWELRDVAPHS